MSDRDGSTILDSVIPFVWKLGSVVVGLVAIAAGFLYVKQDSLLYFPEIGGIPRRPRQNPRRYRSPQEHGLPFEDHKILCSDGVSIHSWLILQPQPKKVPTLIFFHGNAGNIGLRLPNAVQMYQHLKCNILMVEYRGYGDSDTVKPDEAGLKLDAEAALRFIHSNTHGGVDTTQIYLFGRSLGGGVAFHLAHYAEKHSIPLAGLIVENTYLSISKMVDHLMPFVAPLKSLVLRIGWNNEVIAPLLTKTPVLYLAGAQDQLVPHSHMVELYQLSKQQTTSMARMHIVENGTHNETWMQGGRKYWERITRFFAEVHSFQRSGGAGSFHQSSMSSMDDVSPTDGVTVGMGGDAASAVASATAIPTMPMNLVGMAKEATSKVLASATLTKNDDKKKE
mmetsp:Transcript_21360/g.35320  ORF Transcript_21360/g.35320 Transcript_21360/m.35320 type:complete len:393 (-) Transcript_21360:119-1297(-)|eukprot:CAMPEP_0119010420 /NCGR_PEP_ID=MMETSP1176-20130426/4996_1 /TAXON_ID=265551 /ORGANISM="Synedropsis recta cf, Strain CCMP1620" /LENGTH=392 /DNA_ID=CAMNT_0006963073 /DNA_START=35 /DNA_END=1213 /DNA_ORIENTATION=-